MNDDDCYICGRCWWVDCPNDADYTHDVSLRQKRQDGIGDLVFDGKVDLCAGHSHQFWEEKRMNLSWNALEQAVAMQEARR